MISLRNIKSLSDVRALCLLLFVSSLQVTAEQSAHPHLFFIPTAEIIPHGKYYITSRLNMHSRYSGKDSLLPTVHFPVASELMMGFSNWVQVGAQYGNGFSLSFKSRFYEPEDGSMMPDAIWGMRSIFSSAEAGIFEVDDQDMITRLRNEAFVSLGMNIGSKWRVQGGGTALANLAKEGVTVFGGTEIFMSDYVYIGYEFFQRFSSNHHQIHLCFKYKSNFAFTIGASEVQSMLNQGGEWGFYLSPREGTMNGYDAPGIHVSLSIGGSIFQTPRGTMVARLKKVENEQTELKKQVEALAGRTVNTERRMAFYENEESQIAQVKSSQIKDLLDLIIKKMSSDMAYDPMEVRDLQMKILEQRGVAAAVLVNLVVDPTVDINYRIQACIIMGVSGNTQFARVLMGALADPEPKVRKEAILALGKMKLAVAVQSAQAMLKDPDETVRMAAREAIQMIIGSEEERQKERVPMKDLP